MAKLPLTPFSTSSYSKKTLLSLKEGRAFGEGRPQLPIDNMLMISRITRINNDGGAYGRGEIIAELDIEPDLWFFDCHFPNDPVMPGCLGLDALWQLVGFFLGWKGYPGKGRALGASEVKFVGQITPDLTRVKYQININRVINRKLVMGIADGEVIIDKQIIYSAKNLKVGLF